MTTLAQGVVHGVQNPAEFGKAIIDYDTWKQSPGRAIGHLVPDLVLGAATGGAGTAAARSLRGAKALDELGDVAKKADLDAAQDTTARSDAAQERPHHSYGEKITKQLEKRGWTRESVEETIGNPNRTAEARDTRWNPDGTRNNDPATAYINEDGSYVVRNNRTGDIVQVSDRNNPNWRLPFDE